MRAVLCVGQLSLACLVLSTVSCLCPNQPMVEAPLQLPSQKPHGQTPPPTVFSQVFPWLNCIRNIMLYSCCHDVMCAWACLPLDACPVPCRSVSSSESPSSPSPFPPPPWTASLVQRLPTGMLSGMDCLSSLSDGACKGKLHKTQLHISPATYSSHDILNMPGDELLQCPCTPCFHPTPLAPALAHPSNYTYTLQANARQVCWETAPQSADCK